MYVCLFFSHFFPPVLAFFFFFFDIFFFFFFFLSFISIHVINFMLIKLKLHCQRCLFCLCTNHTLHHIIQRLSLCCDIIHRNDIHSNHNPCICSLTIFNDCRNFSRPGVVTFDMINFLNNTKYKKQKKESVYRRYVEVKKEETRKGGTCVCQRYGFTKNVKNIGEGIGLPFQVVDLI